jgi:N-methylhydantoinase A
MSAAAQAVTLTADIDVGGTFTDGFFTHDGVPVHGKVLTTPHDLTDCIVSCLHEGAGLLGMDAGAFLRECSVVRLSTTLGTNTIIERRGPRIGALVTAGHELDLYGDGEPVALGLLLEAEMVVGIEEQVDGQGCSRSEPDAQAVLDAVRGLLERGARTIVVSFANSAVNPSHERLVRELVRERYPTHYLRSIPLQLAHEVSRADDDHARTNTALVNAYIHGDLARGLYRAEDEIRRGGLRRPLLIVHAGGGSARVAKTIAVQTLNSGPAAAVQGTAMMAELLDYAHVVVADIGGTSLDLALVEGQMPQTVKRPWIVGMEMAMPVVETSSIGAGGGSIAEVADGTLTVGPRSAGANPGPACYGKGGMDPTVTDANLILGFLDEQRPLAGRIQLDRQRAEQAITRKVAGKLDLDVPAAAAAIRARIDATMGEALRARIADAALDPASVTLFATGGGGPLHGCAIAEVAGIRSVVGFRFGSVFSAYGSSTTDVLHRYAQRSGADEREDAELLEELTRRASVDMRGEGFGPEDFTTEIERDEDELVLLSRAPVPHWSPASETLTEQRPQPPRSRAVRWGEHEESRATSIFELADLDAGAIVEGPALLDAGDSSFAVAPGWSARIDAFGNVVMERG